MNKMTVRDIEVTGKRVLVRVDFNVPLDEKTGAITDDSRIRATLPTIEYLIDRRARVVLMSHLGRPKGKVANEFRLAPIARRLSQILGQPVGIATDCVGTEVEKAAAALKAGDVLLLENIRFHPEEEGGSPAFAQALASLGDVFVNDAFGTSHRAHASVAGIAKYLPAVAGLLLEKEINTLGNLLKNPARPFCALLGGAKVSDKVGMLENIMSKVDCVLIGGGMAATFLKAKSYDVGMSSVEVERLSTATKLINAANKNGVRIVLPVDVVTASEISNDAKIQTVSVDSVPKDRRIVDIGTRTIENFRKELASCKTVFWNGPLGIYEILEFAKGTLAMAKFLASLKAVTIIGGGSTAEVVNAMGLADKMTFVSTGGGASLEFLSGETLPGVDVLLDKVVAKRHV